MQRIQVLPQLRKLATRHGVTLSYADAAVLVEFAGGRKQLVRFEQADDELTLRSAVLAPRDVKEIGSERVLREVFERNADLHGVGLRPTARGGVEAWCTLDAEEADDAPWLFARVVVLAREADRLEAVWLCKDEA